MVKEVTSEAEFDELTKNESRLVVVDFFATWCGPCKQIAPDFASLSDAHSDVVFLKVDVDKLDGLAAKHSVNAMPTFLFLKNGVKVDSVLGAAMEKVKQTVAKHT